MKIYNNDGDSIYDLIFECKTRFGVEGDLILTSEENEYGVYSFVKTFANYVESGYVKFPKSNEYGLGKPVFVTEVDFYHLETYQYQTIYDILKERLK